MTINSINKKSETVTPTRAFLHPLRTIGDFPLTFVDFDATSLSIQDGEWQRPVNDSRYSAESAIRRIGILHRTRRRASTQSEREGGTRFRDRS